MTRRWALAAASVAAGVPGLILGFWLLGPRISFDGRRGDWRAVSEGLRRTQDRTSLSASSRAVVHFHALGCTPAELTLRVALRDAAEPMWLTAKSGGALVFDRPLDVRPVDFSVSVAAGARDVDVYLEATPLQGSPARLYRIDSITLQRRGVRVRIGQVLPAVAAIVTLLIMWARGHRLAALGGALAAGALVAWLWLLAFDPEAQLRVRPPAREACLAGALGGLWALALAGTASRVMTAAATLGTVALVYGAAIHYPFVGDDYLWARPWSFPELLRTLAGPEDPKGIALGRFRPLADWTRAADYRLWGVDARGWHLFNLSLHALNGLLAKGVLERFALSPRVALAGALVYLVHPLSASTAAWATQRTDGLMVLFYLVALRAGLAPTLQPSNYVIAGLATLLALASKESAVTVPLVTWLARVVAVTPPRPGTRRLLALGVAIVAVYGLYWSWLFSGQLAFRARALPGGGLSRLIQLAGGLYAPLYAPTGYERWYDTRVGEWPTWYMLTALAVALLPWTWIAFCHECRSRKRLAALALLWPAIVAVPMLGVRIVDLYRLGFLLCFAFALTWSALAAHAEHKRPWLPALLTALLGLWLAPLGARTAAAWSSDGFQARRFLERDRQDPAWLAGLEPEAKALFFEQVDRRDHARAFAER